MKARHQKKKRFIIESGSEDSGSGKHGIENIVVGLLHEYIHESRVIVTHIRVKIDQEMLVGSLLLSLFLRISSRFSIMLTPVTSNIRF